MEARATSPTSRSYPRSSPPTESAALKTAPEAGERVAHSDRGPYSSVPRVIFGTSGSGTRALAEIAQRAGYFMGTRLTHAKDSEDLIAFFEKWINRYVSHTRWLHNLLEGGPVQGEAPFPEMERDFAAAIERHRAALSDKTARWGWKGPRSMYVLPFLHLRYPDMIAIHLIRDGRDMAYSKNQHELLRGHSEPVLDGDFQALPEPVHSIKLWSRINLATARYGERYLGEQYLQVRFEDLCSDRTTTVARVLEFAGSDASPETVRAIADAAVRPPPTIHRWRARDARERQLVVREGATALQEFGYL